eukprot:scaffold5918_cov130-Cylindrotheca_fusiformis.AAC.1
MSSVMDSTFSDESSFTGTFTTTERTSTTQWNNQPTDFGTESSDELHHSSDDYHYKKPQGPQKSTLNIIEERDPEFADDTIIGVGSDEEKQSVHKALNIVDEDLETGVDPTLDAIPETVIPHDISQHSYGNKPKNPPLHYKRAGDEEFPWVGPEESKQPSIVSMPDDDRSHSSNSWFMPGYNFHDQAPRPRNVQLFYKQEPPASNTIDLESRSEKLPKNLNPVSSFTSWVPTPYLVKPEKPNPEPARMSHREPLEEDPWVVSQPLQNMEETKEGSTSDKEEDEDEETVEVFMEEQDQEKEEDISTFPDEEFSETDYNDEYSDESSILPAPQQKREPPQQEQVPPPLLPSSSIEESKVRWKPTQYGNWDDESSSSSSADDSSAFYDRSLSWDGFSSSSSSASSSSPATASKGTTKTSSKRSKSSKKREPRRGKRAVPQDLALDHSQNTTSELSSTTRSKISSNPDSGHKMSVASFDPSFSSSEASPSSSSSSSSSSSANFEDEYEQDDDNDWLWDPSFRSLVCLVIINVAVMTGIAVGILFWRLGSKHDTGDEMPSPSPGGNGPNIFNNTQASTR